MRKLYVMVVIFIVSLSLIGVADAKRKRLPNDQGINIVEKNVCTDLCNTGKETIYVYENVADPLLCEKIGGEMYSHQGYQFTLACKVMHPKRCKEQEGTMGEFHFPFLPKNFTHLGCTADMKPDDCRDVLRQVYAAKPAQNKYFMNNVGCLAR